MGPSKISLRLAASVCLLALAACSGGGGGGGTALNTGGGNSTPTAPTTPTTPAAPTTPTVSIGAPDNANVTIQTASFNFAGNPPPIGAVFGLLGPAVKITATTVEAANKGTNGTLTYRGLSNGIPTFDLNIPALNLSVTNIRGDGTPATVPSGGSALLAVGIQKYTAGSIWSFTTGGVNYVGVSSSGSGTPIANVPISGSATYSGSGGGGAGTAGFSYVPDGNGGISKGALTGDIVVNVNFGTGAVNGSLNHMTVTPGDGSAARPWNDVALSGNINRLASNASFTGTTSTSGPPSGAGNAGFSSAATGQLGGAFFGPNVDEVGGTWTLTDPNAAGGGKTAFGVFGAASNGCSGCSLSGGGTTPPPSSGVSITAPGTGFSTFSGTGVGTSFTSNPPPQGTTIGFGGGTAAITPTTFGNFNTSNTSPATATYRGTVTTNGVTYPVFDLNIPSLSISATNVRGDNTAVTLANGGTLSLGAVTTSYTLLGVWTYLPASGGTNYLANAVTGYGTPPASVPTSGSATYTGAGGVIGEYAVPNGTNAIELGTVKGDLSLNVNFATNTANGTFTNMTSKVAGGSTTTPWNDVSLSGSLTRRTSDVLISGQTSTATNSNPAGLSNAARGAFNGSMYGPTGQEVGGMWNLSEPTAGGGKAAFGVFIGHQ